MKALNLMIYYQVSTLLNLNFAHKSQQAHFCIFFRIDNLANLKNPHMHPRIYEI